jgi:hypothetical protein
MYFDEQLSDPLEKGPAAATGVIGPRCTGLGHHTPAESEPELAHADPCGDESKADLDEQPELDDGTLLREALMHWWCRQRKYHQGHHR